MNLFRYTDLVLKVIKASRFISDIPLDHCQTPVRDNGIGGSVG